MSKFIRTYKEILNQQPLGMRTKMRNRYLDIFANKRMDKSKLPSKAVLFILFHSLFEDQKENYRTLLLQIQKEYTFISYSACVEKLQSGDIDGRYACISADDGFKNFMDAADLFDELSIPGMVFVNSHLIGETDEKIIQAHCKNKLTSLPMEFLNWDELEDLRKRNHEIGNHGWKHEKLTTLDSGQMQEEIEKGKTELEKYLGPIKHYAYTYGMKQFINQTAMDLIFQAGHTSLASAIRGQHKVGIDTTKELILREQFECWYPSRHVNYFLERHIRT